MSNPSRKKPYRNLKKSFLSNLWYLFQQKLYYQLLFAMSVTRAFFRVLMRVSTTIFTKVRDFRLAPNYPRRPFWKCPRKKPNRSRQKTLRISTQKTLGQLFWSKVIRFSSWICIKYGIQVGKNLTGTSKKSFFVQFMVPIPEKIVLSALICDVRDGGFL